jgi:hypothetical protein
VTSSHRRFTCFPFTRKNAAPAAFIQFVDIIRHFLNAVNPFVPKKGDVSWFRSAARHGGTVSLAFLQHDSPCGKQFLCAAQDRKLTGGDQAADP